MKGQFQSTESMTIFFPPFIDKTTSTEILGTDICTITVKKPNAAIVTYDDLSTPAVTFDSDIGLWKLTLTTGVYMQGTWLVMAESDAANTLPQRKVITWGDFVDDITTAKTQATTAATQATTAATQATTAATQATLARKIASNRWKIDTALNQFYIYDDNGTSILYTFDLTDEAGDPTATRIFERARV